jgi:hypothetical protein
VQFGLPILIAQLESMNELNCYFKNLVSNLKPVRFCALASKKHVDFMNGPVFPVELLVK